MGSCVPHGPHAPWHRTLSGPRPSPPPVLQMECKAPLSSWGPRAALGWPRVSTAEEQPGLPGTPGQVPSGSGSWGQWLGLDRVRRKGPPPMGCWVVWMEGGGAERVCRTLTLAQAGWEGAAAGASWAWRPRDRGEAGHLAAWQPGSATCYRRWLEQHMSVLCQPWRRDVPRQAHGAGSSCSLLSSPPGPLCPHLLFSWRPAVWGQGRPHDSASPQSLL